MSSSEIRKKFLDYFAAHGHAVVPSSSLLPDDPSVLLTTAGMQQFKPYYTGEADPMVSPHPALKGVPLGKKNATSIQKCFRTSDIDEVGDDTHLTFFEMMGNFSFGGYFKKEAIKYVYEFIAKEMGLRVEYVTIFQGNESIPRDFESAEIWRLLNPAIEVREAGMEDNFWGPTGSRGPCGPTTEIYIKNAKGESVEIWNVVFNEYLCAGSREDLMSGFGDHTLEKLEVLGVDTGMGLERLTMTVQQKATIFDTDLFAPLMDMLPERLDTRKKRIIADHCRGTAFLLSDGVRPSNKEAGYVLRRLMRRVMVYEYIYRQANPFDTLSVLEKVTSMYQQFYPELDWNVIYEETIKEKEKFEKSVARGLRELEKTTVIGTEAAFRLYETFGLPYEIIKELGGIKAEQLNRQDFDVRFKKHQEISRAGQEAKFGGHGLILDTGELRARDEEELKKVTRLHTATHLLQAGLRKVLGDSIHQDGSDITVERLRFDFNFDRKLTDEEIKQVEGWVNEIVKRDVPMGFTNMPFEKAKASGALYSNKEKYPAVVKVYSAQDHATGEVFTKELCGGPHVTHTGEVGVFKITKQEAVSAGVRRIRAIVEG
ncbi:MAG: alanine--tRNA ligase [Candidatus Spechtbacteria bacterium]|nr:alanine--tRNA ligase [Candidatus Spechtbacteria bacterium]